MPDAGRFSDFQPDVLPYPVDDRDGGLDVASQLDQLGQGEPPVHRDHNRPEAHAGELNLERAGVALG